MSNNMSSAPSIPIEVRKERPGDQADIYRVTTLAFGQSAEADLIDALCDGGFLEASSVAEREGEIVAHAALSLAHIATRNVLALAPVSVIPECQGEGVGSAVVRHLLESAEGTAVTVLGDPGYYGRFGFVDAAAFGISDPFSPSPGPSQILWPNGVPPGVISYAPPFLDL